MLAESKYKVSLADGERPLINEKEWYLTPGESLLPPNQIGFGILPTSLCVSSFFVPLNRNEIRGQRVGNELIHPSKLCSIRMLGLELDESDLDVLMGLIIFANRRNFNEHFRFNRHQFLKVIHPRANGFGGNDYAWLDKTLERIRNTLFSFEQVFNDGDKVTIGDSCNVPILSSLSFVGDTGKVEACFDPRFAQLFHKKQYVFIDIEFRANLRNHLSRALYVFLCAMKDQRQYYLLSWLIKRFDYHSSEGKVRTKISRALDELKEAGYVRSYSWKKITRWVEKDQVVTIELAKGTKVPSIVGIF